MDCVWLLSYEEGQQIVLSRFSINMEHSDTVTCGQRGASYVTIRNGGTVSKNEYHIPKVNINYWRSKNVAPFHLLLIFENPNCFKI